MKKIIFFVFFVLVWCSYSPCSVLGQEKRNFLTYEQLKNQVDELPLFFKRYEDSKIVLQNRYYTVSRSQYDPDSELFKQAFTDLVLAYKESRNTLNSYSELWVTFFIINERPQLLIDDGWTQKEVDFSRVWTDSFKNYRDKIRKIDSKTVSVDQIQNFMIKVNPGLVTLF